MTTIYKIPSISQRYFDYTQNAVVTVEHNFIITDNLLKYKLTVDSITELDFELTLSELKASNRFSENSWLTFTPKFKNIDDTFINLELPGPVSHTVFDRNSIVNLLDYTTIDKSNNIRNLLDTSNPSRYIPFKFFVKSISDNFNTFVYTLEIPKQDDDAQHTTIVKLNNETITCEQSPGNWKSFIDTITATTEQTSVTAGTTIKVNISTDSSLQYVYLEQVTGMLDRLKVKLNNGQGSFNILTDTLTAGEVAEVKIGHKKFSNVTTFTKTLS